MCLYMLSDMNVPVRVCAMKDMCSCMFCSVMDRAVSWNKDYAMLYIDNPVRFSAAGSTLKLHSQTRLSDSAFSLLGGNRFQFYRQR